MGETAMVGKAENRIPEVSQDVDISRFGRQRHRGRSQRRLAIEPGACETGAGQKVSDRLQSFGSIAIRRVLDDVAADTDSFEQCTSQAGTSRVTASGTMLISTGRVPSSSPSASTKMRKPGAASARNWQPIFTP